MPERGPALYPLRLANGLDPSIAKKGWDRMILHHYLFRLFAMDCFGSNIK
jgi:hypothetical protein